MSLSPISKNQISFLIFVTSLYTYVWMGARAHTQRERERERERSERSDNELCIKNILLSAKIMLATAVYTDMLAVWVV